MSKVRLLKVIVQPILVLDDGDTLTELPQPATAVGPAQVASIPDELASAVERLQAEIDTGGSSTSSEMDTTR